MTMQTLGVKLNASTRERLKVAATMLDRTPHWLMKQAIQLLIERVETGTTVDEIVGAHNVKLDIERHSVASRRNKYETLEQLIG